MKDLVKILVVLLGISFASAAFATVANGPVRDSNTVLISPADLTYVATIGANDNFIITERTPDGYKVDGNWTVNISNFVDQGPSGSVNFSIKFDAGGKTATANAQVNMLLGSVLIPASGNTLLTNTSTITIPDQWLFVSKGNGELVLTWDPVPNAVSYRLYRGDVANTGYFRKISNNAVSPYTDSGLNTSTTYFYVLVAVDGSGATSPHSNYISEVPNGTAVSVTGLTISPTSATLFDGASQTFTARATFNGGVQSNVTASYDTPSQGTISGSTYTAPTLVAVDNTPVTITANYLFHSASATITLRKKTVTSISISPISATLYDNQNQVFTVNANYNDGTSSAITTLPTVLSRSGSGDISGYTYTAPPTIGADETVTIDANFEGKTAPSATIYLKKKALDSISISPNGAVLNLGDSQPFTVTATFNGSRDATVSSSDPNLQWKTGVGTITNGLFTSTRGGNGTVTATYTYDGGTPKSAYVNVLLGYSQMLLRVENNKANIYAKDTGGNEFPVISYDSVAFTATGTPDGNRVGLDGTLTEGTKEGPYAVSASVSIAGRTFTPTGAWNVNKGAPVAKVLIGTTQVSNDNIIDSKPTFTINVTDGNGVKSVRLFIDVTEITAPALSLTANDAASTSVTASYAVSTPLAAGNHTLRLVTEDNLGTQGTVDITGLKVYDELSVSGIPKNYPNPFKPSSGVGTKIHYTLTQAADIKLMIYDLAGRPVYTVLYPRDPNGNSQGGKAGDNDVDFNGKDFNGKLMPNGVYKYFITSAGKVLASGELAVYD